MWDASDGRCLVSAAHLLSFRATVMTSLPNRRFVAAAGHSQNIEIFDAWTLKACLFYLFQFVDFVFATGCPHIPWTHRLDHRPVLLRCRLTGGYTALLSFPLCSVYFFAAFVCSVIFSLAS